MGTWFFFFFLNPGHQAKHSFCNKTNIAIIPTE